MLKIAILGITGVILALFLKGTKPEFAVITALISGLLILVFCVHKLDGMLGYIEKLQKYVRLNQGFIGILIKMAGISFVSDITSAICKECGYTFVAGQVELFARISVAVISMPIILSLFETIESALKL